MRTLVINLTRFGDLLQSQPAISGLKAQGGETGVVCLENFRAAAGLLSDVDAVYSLPGGRLLAGLEKHWPSSFAEVRSWIAGIEREFSPERVVNITPSLTGRLVTRFWERAEIAGMGLDENGFSLNASPWAAFLQSASVHRGCSPFNVADLFWEVAGLGEGERAYRIAPPSADAQEAVEAMIAGDMPEGVLGVVGFQLGASEDRRRWPLEYFAALGAMLWEKWAFVPVLLGGGNETRLGERYAAVATAPFINLIGRTGLPELAAALARLRLLVTNDTGTMHLAAGLGTPIAAVFLCTAQPWDTGPYLEGSLCLEPDMGCHPCAFGIDCPREETCRRSIAPETVFSHLDSFLSGHGWGECRPGAERAFVAGREADGAMTLEPLPGQPLDDRILWVYAQRRLYSQFLDGKEPAPWTGMPENFSAETSAALVKTLDEALGICNLLQAQGRLLVTAPREALKAKFLGYWQRLLSVLGDDSRLAPLGQLLLSQAQECGNDLGGYLLLVGRYMELFNAVRQTVRP